MSNTNAQLLTVDQLAENIRANARPIALAIMNGASLVPANINLSSSAIDAVLNGASAAVPAGGYVHESTEQNGVVNLNVVPQSSLSPEQLTAHMNGSAIPTPRGVGSSLSDHELSELLDGDDDDSEEHW